MDEIIDNREVYMIEDALSGGMYVIRSGENSRRRNDEKSYASKIKEFLRKITLKS